MLDPEAEAKRAVDSLVSSPARSDETIVEDVTRWEKRRRRLTELVAAATQETLAEEELGRLYSRPGAARDRELIDAHDAVSRARERRREAVWELEADGE